MADDEKGPGYSLIKITEKGFVSLDEVRAELGLPPTPRTRDLKRKGKRRRSYEVTDAEDLLLISDAIDGDLARVVSPAGEMTRYFYDGVRWREAQREDRAESSRYARDLNAQEKLAAAVIEHGNPIKGPPVPAPVKPYERDMDNDAFAVAMKARAAKKEQSR